LLQRLQYYRLRMKGSKGQYLKREVTFLGLKVNGMGIRPDERKCELISKLRAPKTGKAMRSFLATVSYFRKFIPGYAAKTAIFRPLLKANAPWNWSDEHQKRFEELRDYLKSNDVMLAHPRWEYPMKLVTDSSKEACGYVLLNETPEGDRAIFTEVGTGMKENRNYILMNKSAAQ